ncbi:hypothetical protein A5662_05715 [Mycobacteriaceae bacterium 1482268.1]|nr:hypothetical protein A5662_05715 [Mycobacteriaceae bacterium 1482268.1]
MGSLSQKLASREITKTEFKTGATAAKSTFKTGLTDAKTQFKADLAQQTHTTTNTATTGN